MLKSYMKKNLIFLLIPLFLLLLTGEIFCRVKLYLYHNDAYYLTAPFLKAKLIEAQKESERQQVVYELHVEHFLQDEKYLKRDAAWDKWHRGEN